MYMYASHALCVCVCVSVVTFRMLYSENYEHIYVYVYFTLCSARNSLASREIVLCMVNVLGSDKRDSASSVWANVPILGSYQYISTYVSWPGLICSVYEPIPLFAYSCSLTLKLNHYVSK